MQIMYVRNETNVNAAASALSYPPDIGPISPVCLAENCSSAFEAGAGTVTS